MRRHVTPLRALGGIVVLLLASLLILFSLPSGKYILLVDAAHPVAPYVQVPGAQREAGGGTVYFVDVRERKASELEALFPWLRPHASLVPASDIVPPCASAGEAEAAQLQEMRFSQHIAAAVALRKLGYHVVVHPSGVLVSQLVANTNAPCNLQPMDVIVAVDGSPTPTLPTLHTALGRVKPGAVVALRVRRAGRTLTVRIKTVGIREEAGGPRRAFVGFAPEQAATIKLPIRVSINLPSVGGPSAGLAFALEVMRRLGRNVLHGHRVAATGEMELDGRVGPIGGVKQKTYGARQAGADVFLVPAGGGNARDAKRYAGSLRIIPVRTFGQALRALATLPRTQ
ncbi:MAG: S16 family serine protease [Gaiellaceae bacterium]